MGLRATELSVLQQANKPAQILSVSSLKLLWPYVQDVRDPKGIIQNKASLYPGRSLTAPLGKSMWKGCVRVLFCAWHRRVQVHMQVSQVEMGVFLHVLYLITVTGSRISLLNSELISSAKPDVQFAVTTLSPSPVSLPCSRIYMSVGNSNSCPYNGASSTLSTDSSSQPRTLIF